MKTTKRTRILAPILGLALALGIGIAVGSSGDDLETVLIGIAGAEPLDPIASPGDTVEARTTAGPPISGAEFTVAQQLGPWAPVSACESGLGRYSPNVLQIVGATYSEVVAAMGLEHLGNAGNHTVLTQRRMADYLAFEHPGSGLGRWSDPNGHNCGQYYNGCYTRSAWHVCANGAATPVAAAQFTPANDPTDTPRPFEAVEPLDFTG